MNFFVAALAAAIGATIAVALSAMSDATLLTVAEWTVYAALPAANGFVIVYGFTRPWYRSQIGRALMTKALGVAALFDLSAYAQVTKVQLPIRLSLMVVALVVVGIWYQFIVLALTPRDKPRRGDV